VKRWKSRAELWKLMPGLPGVRVHFSRSQVAASLWDYSEDDLATRSLAMSDADLARIQAIASWYEDPNYPLPIEGQCITHNHVIALAAISFYERAVRPLTRTRRRPEKERPFARSRRARCQVTESLTVPHAHADEQVTQPWRVRSPMSTSSGWSITKAISPANGYLKPP
jgi:PIN domain nuclease of toxin-antitoxin system